MIGANPKDVEKTTADIKAIKQEMLNFFNANETTFETFLMTQIYDVRISRQIDGTYKITITLKYPGIFLGPDGKQGKAILQHLSDTVGVNCGFVLVEHNIWK